MTRFALVKYMKTCQSLHWYVIQVFIKNIIIQSYWVPPFSTLKCHLFKKKNWTSLKNIGLKIMKLCPNIQTCQSLQLIKSNVFIKNMLLSWIYVLHHYQWGIRWIWWIKTFLTVIYFLKINKYNIIYENVSIITLI